MSNQRTSDTPPSPTDPKSTAPLRKPSIDTSTPAINSAPIELDSTPVSPVKRADSWPVRREGVIASPDMHEGVYGELSGDKGESVRSREKRNELLEKRRLDKGVLVDIPDTPDAEDFEVAEEMVGKGVAERQGGEEKTKG